ncbi:MAG: glycosyltransferase family 2 protein [Pyramidobacter sp.]|nr:glycosyltransferase family 2 protein [Pyramidobacter sp.]
MFCPQRPVLFIVVPCFNEEEALSRSSLELRQTLEKMVSAGLASDRSKILFVDDGSRDRTWELICRFHAQDAAFTGLRLSRNCGHQNALLACLMAAKEQADIAVSIDADLQDDVSVIERMARKYAEGCEIVYGVRSSRKTDTFFKRFSAETFYKLLRFMGVEVVFNHADFRLMSKKALDALADYKEVNLFLRGLIPLLGFSSGVVEYERRPRAAGETKYPLRKMLKLAFDGISSFSVRPIRMISCLGGVIFAASLLVLLWTLWAKLAGRTVSGWTSLMISIWALGGIQLLSLGLIGEYIGKIYTETKARPRYIVAETLLE